MFLAADSLQMHNKFYLLNYVNVFLLCWRKLMFWSLTTFEHVNPPTVARIVPSLPPFAPVPTPTQSLARITCPSIILCEQR